MKLDALDTLSVDESRALLREIFIAFSTPAFGALPSRETNIVIFDAMRKAGVIAADATLYDLMTTLRISRAKARNLLFDLEIRRMTDMASLDAKLKDEITRPRGFVLDGAYIAIGIENPVVQAHMKERVRELGHLTDASFDSALVKLKPGALAALVEALMTKTEHDNFKKAMIDAGLKENPSLRTALTAGLEHLAGKIVGDKAAEVGKDLIGEGAEQVTDFVAPHAEKAMITIKSVLRAIFGATDDEEPTAPGPQIRSTNE